MKIRNLLSLFILFALFARDLNAQSTLPKIYATGLQTKAVIKGVSISLLHQFSIVGAGEKWDLLEVSYEMRETKEGRGVFGGSATNVVLHMLVPGDNLSYSSDTLITTAQTDPSVRNCLKSPPHANLLTIT